jgi:hypothetical protein
MSRAWDQERYVRLFTRDTPGWVMGSWQMRALMPNLMRKLDRNGEIDLAGFGVAGLAATVLLPVEVVGPGLESLVAQGTAVIEGETLRIPNFRAAQDFSASNAERQKAYRERAKHSSSFASPSVSEPSAASNGALSDLPQTGLDELEGHVGKVAEGGGEGKAEPTVTKVTSVVTAVTNRNDRYDRCNTVTPSVPSVPTNLPTREEALSLPLEAQALKVPSRVKPKTRCPASDASHEEVAEWASKHKLPLGDPELAKMLDWHRANGKLSGDWGASWRTWKGNASRFSNRPNGRPLQGGGLPDDCNTPDKVW